MFIITQAFLHADRASQLAHVPISCYAKKQSVDAS